MSKEVPDSNIFISPLGNVASDFWYLNQGYPKVDTIKAGYGYWVKFFEPGYIILRANSL